MTSNPNNNDLKCRIMKWYPFSNLKTPSGHEALKTNSDPNIKSIITSINNILSTYLKILNLFDKSLPTIPLILLYQ